VPGPTKAASVSETSAKAGAGYLSDVISTTKRISVGNWASKAMAAHRLAKASASPFDLSLSERSLSFRRCPAEYLHLLAAALSCVKATPQPLYLRGGISLPAHLAH
jgi:hypothetical protein